jgi:DNA-binding MarR family transcriptional regulator
MNVAHHSYLDYSPYPPYKKVLPDMPRLSVLPHNEYVALTFIDDLHAPVTGIRVVTASLEAGMPLSRSATYIAVGKLLEKKLITKKPSKNGDKRRYFLATTAKGRKALVLARQHYERLANLPSPISVSVA